MQCGSNEDKMEALSNLYGVATIGQAMIFCHVNFPIIPATYIPRHARVFGMGGAKYMHIYYTYIRMHGSNL